MLCSIFLFLKSLFFNFGFWWSLIFLVISVVYVFLDFSKCISMCWKGAKGIEEKLAMLRAPLIKGAIFIVVGIIVFRSSILLTGAADTPQYNTLIVVVSFLANMTVLLGVSALVERAPEKVVNAEREKLARAQERMNKILESIEALG